LSAAAPASAQQAANNTAQAQATVPTIIVTAERQETNLQTTPVAVTAISLEAIQANHVQNLADLDNLAPGLNVLRSGSQNNIQYNLRGVNSTAFLPGQSSGVATYIDGVYVGVHNGSAADFADIERVEVLRGPQGTLFGQNSNGGAVVITTRMPSGEFHAKQEFTAGNYGQFRSKTVLDLPSFGKLSSLFTYVHNQRRGDITNLGAGTQWDFGPVSKGVLGIYTSPKHLGDRNSDTFAATLKLQASDDMDWVFRYDGTRATFSDQANGILGDPSNVAGAFPFGFPMASWLALSPAIRTPIALTRPDAVNNYFSLPFHQNSNNFSLTGTWNLNDHWRLRNITAYREVTLDVHSMLDAAAGGNPVIPGVPFTVQSAASYDHDYMFTNEFQVFYTSKWLDVTSGVSYYKDRIALGPRVEPGACTSGACFASTSTQPYVIAPGAALRSNVGTHSVAPFLQAKVHLTDRFYITGGVRDTMDFIKGVDNLSGTTVNQDYFHNKMTWLAGVNWQATDAIFAYATASTGYIRGGQLGGINFSPEYAKSYEAGIKADMFDHTLRTNLALYDAHYRNVQQAGLLAGAGPGGGGLTVIFSVGDSHTYGAELETTWVTPLKGLTLSGTLSHENYNWQRFNPIYLLYNGLTGSQVQSIVPKWTGNIAAQYDGEDMSFGGHFTGRVDVNYRGAKYLVPTWYTPTERQNEHVGGRALLNARIALTDIPAGPTKAEVALWGRNLTNNASPLNTLFIGYLSTTYEFARTFGVDVKVEY
jgi:iron complex outermembrane receptor protein